MSERTTTSVYAGAILVMAVTLLSIVITAPTSEDRVASIGDRIKCPVCQGESIANSPSQMARDMMSLVQERVESGTSDEEIIAELLSSYSGAVLLDPPPTGNTLALWLAPLVALIIGGGVIYWWMRHAPAEATASASQPSRRSVIGWIAFALALGAIVVVAGFSLQERAGPASGVADLDAADLEQVSNETMEAVIAANIDHPEINGMRLALAGRYVVESNYGAAIGHYLGVAESPAASDAQRVVALVQMGRLVWDGNAEAELAIGLFDQALEVNPESVPALYHKAIVAWCGLGDFETASALLTEVLELESSPDLAGAAEDSLAAVLNGEACT